MATYASGALAPWLADPRNQGTIRGDTVAPSAMEEFRRQLAESGVVPGPQMPYAKAGNRRFKSGLRLPAGDAAAAAAPVYAETGDPQFKSGLVTPTSTVEVAPDPARQAALAALALQQVQNSPLGASGFGGPASLGEAFAQAVRAGQLPAQPPSTILGAPQYTNTGGPIPLSRRIG